MQTNTSQIDVTSPLVSSTCNTELELWGGVECSVTRVMDRYMDQVLRSGHQVRMADLDLFKELGIRALRYPVIWEKTAPRGIEKANWRWSDERLNRLQDVGIVP